MTLELTAHDQSLLDGAQGEGAALAMRILVRMAETVGAPRLLDIEMAHIDSALFQGDATLEYAERLADGGARVVVPSTLNVAGVDVHGWEDWDVPPAWATKARRQMDAYERMGCTPTWTCAPYQTEARPAFGQQIAWGESSAIVFANSVLGARTERYPDLLDICCAITGRAPAVGLHLEENRAGQVLLRFDDVPLEIQQTDEFPAVLGHWVGREVGSRVPVLEGLSIEPSEDQLKALGAAMASSGAVALFHWVGVTPEAPDLNSALRGGAPLEERRVDALELARTRSTLTSADSAALDLVVLGSPHFSLDEFRALAPLVAGRRRAAAVRFLVTCGRGVQAIAEAAGLFAPLREFGAEVTVDTCILTTPMLPDDVRTLMTNSAKFAYYTPGLLARSVTFGSLRDCVESAVQGRVVRRRGPWERLEESENMT
jgi:cis-L-3-hydroxyproline dehydratase